MDKPHKWQFLEHTISSLNVDTHHLYFQIKSDPCKMHNTNVYKLESMLFQKSVKEFSKK